ncbi:MAG: hypothetical protein OQK55_01065 [Thermoanaerobaculales bacterium]|nr:hypothetical protein [Thermoanaerobaculales bacterium]
MDRKSIAELDSESLMELVRGRHIDELEVLQVLRSPFCTAQIAETIASDPGLMGTHEVREKLAGFPGFTFGRALDLLATLPWTSLLSLSQSPRTPPVVRRQAERKLLAQLVSMALGEKIALARRAHREIFRVLIGTGDGQVLSALLNNPRLVENDILVILNTSEPPPEFFGELASHRKWGPYIRIRRALVTCPFTPLPLALSVLVQLSVAELRRVLEHPDLPQQVREAAQSLLDREASGQRRMIRSSGDDSDGGGAQPPEGLW